MAASIAAAAAGHLRLMASARRAAEVKRRDLPRNRLLRDEQLTEIAAHAPADVEALARSRGLARGIADGRQGAAILEAVRRGLAVPPAECPTLPPRAELPSGLRPVVDLLRVLLRTKCELAGVADRLVASGDDLQLIAADDRAAVPALAGWRRELFGDDALSLKHGRTALTTDGREVRIVSLVADRSAAS